jgi:type IV secretion system protein VirB9
MAMWRSGVVLLFGLAVVVVVGVGQEKKAGDSAGRVFSPTRPGTTVVTKQGVPAAEEYQFDELIGQLQADPRRSAQANPAMPAPAGSVPLYLKRKDSANDDDRDSEVPADFVADKTVPLPEDASEAIDVDGSWKNQSALPSPGEDGRVVYTYGAGLPTVVCAPLRLCVIELESGERLMGEPHVGDSVRWLIDPATSGEGALERALIVVKPKGPGLDTNMLLTTDRRLYYLRLVSTPSEYIARTSFEYPAAETARWQAHLLQSEQRRKEAVEQAQLAPLRTIEDLYFDYRVLGKHHELRPVRIFDDGEKTYVQMREQILHRELPILVVVGTQGPEMVNYRVKGTVYVVDRIFEHGALILGEGKKAKRLDIVRGTFRGKVKGDGFSASFSGKPEVER